MKAILIDQPGGVENMYLGEWTTPKPGPHEILVKVVATALNRADTMQRQGKYPPPPGTSPLMGLGMTGTVADMGANVSRWKKGDEICGLLAGGGYAEYAVIHEDLAMPVPANISLLQASAIPEVFMTAFQALFWLGGLKPGQQVLLHAGASGVGTAAIQLARETEAQVWATASATKHQICLDLGAERVIDYKTESFRQVIKEQHHKKGIDLIIDPIGAPYLPDNLEVLLPDGKLVILAFMGGMISEINLAQVLVKRLHILGTTLRARSLEYKIALCRDLQARFWAKFADASIQPVIDCEFDWTEVQQAHRYMEANKNVGKIVLKVSG